MRELCPVVIPINAGVAAFRRRSQARFRGGAVRVVDPAVEAPTVQHANLDLDHVEPTGMLGGVVEL